jgi:hypothetical protein
VRRTKAYGARPYEPPNPPMSENWPKAGQNQPKTSQKRPSSTSEMSTSHVPGRPGGLCCSPHCARRRGPFLRTPLSSRVGNGPPVLSFTPAVFVCGIPRSECVICRVPLFHRHDHTPHYDSAIRQPALFLPQVAGAAQEPRARFATNTIHLLFCILGRSRYVEPAE